MSDYVYDLMKKHHSVRQFKDKALSDETVQKLVEAGQSASTSSYLQTYSIIGVDDPEIKKQLKEVSGQPYVVDNGYLFVFVLDYYRHNLINENVDFDMQTSFESAEGLLVGAIDVALVSENVALAAEDMGYGIVYLGSLRNDVARVKEILDLPEYAFPLFGMAVGEPADDENGAPKPRLPLNMYSIKTLTIAMLKNKEKLFRNMMRKSVSIIKNVRMENVKKHGHNKLLGS